VLCSTRSLASRIIVSPGRALHRRAPNIKPITSAPANQAEGPLSHATSQIELRARLIVQLGQRLAERCALAHDARLQYVAATTRALTARPPGGAVRGEQRRSEQALRDRERREARLQREATFERNDGCGPRADPRDGRGRERQSRSTPARRIASSEALVRLDLQQSNFVGRHLPCEIDRAPSVALSEAAIGA